MFEKDNIIIVQSRHTALESWSQRILKNIYYLKKEEKKKREGLVLGDGESEKDTREP